MVTNEEFGQMVSEFESLRDVLLEEMGKIKNELENLREDFDDLKKEIISAKKK